MVKYYQGIYKPINPSKYQGDPTQIVFRSGWERKFMVWCDHNSAILSWSSEETVIPYMCPTDNKWHRYFVDAKITVQTSTGVRTYLVEIKPFKQTQPPSVPKRKTQQYITEVMTWGKNSAKWKAAREYCKDRNWEFKIITEKELGL